MPNFVDPFFGSGAVLWGRPDPPGIETVNDKDAFISNFYRALQADPKAVAHYADYPAFEPDLHARHAWLVRQRTALTAHVEGDPDYYDVKIAGWWVWGLSCWIGRGWCSGQGPWQVADGQLLPLGNTGQGVHRQLLHLGDAGRGVQRKHLHLGDAGQDIHALHAHGAGLRRWFEALATRLRSVRVCCGDWARVLGPSVTYKHGLTGVVCDPPYSAEEGRDPDIYRVEDLQVAHAVRAWCLENGAHPLLRIVFCGYGTVHDELLAHGWTKASWTANGGLSNQNRDSDNQNKYRETLWCSPHCLTVEQQLSLFRTEERSPYATPP